MNNSLGLRLGSKLKVIKDWVKFDKDLKDMVTVKLTQVKGDLERAMEQKIIQGLEPWLRKGGIIEGARSAESLERTVTVKGKQPMGEEQYTSESLLNTGSREVSLYDMFL